MLASDLLDQWPLDHWRDRKLIVGVSGGADSVALLLALHALAQPGQLVVAHMNHGWRGAESDGDEAFVVKLSKRLGVECLAKRMSPAGQSRLRPANQSDDIACRDFAMLAKIASDENCNASELGLALEKGASPGVLEDSAKKSEQAARQSRYQFFKECAYNIGASFIVTAHTADDRIETVLHNLLRGSGLAGVAALSMLRGLDEHLMLARPLVTKRRREIIAFLEQHQQPFRDDSSNLLTVYSRNFLRHRVLPLIEERYPQAADRLLSFSELAEQLQSDLDHLAEKWLENLQAELVSERPAAWSSLKNWSIASHFIAPLSSMQSQPWSVVRAALRLIWLRHAWPQAAMSREHWQSIRDLSLSALPPHYQTHFVLPGNLHVATAAGFLAIGPPVPT